MNSLPMRLNMAPSPFGRSRDVRWSCENQQLRLYWQESGGPLVEAPEPRGFGTRLIENSLGRMAIGLASTRLCP
jgi:two-component sensor histidine kinase